MLKKFSTFCLMFLTTVSTLFLTSSCSDKDKPYIPLICTPAMIIGELAEGDFKEPTKNVTFSAALTNVVVKCSEDAAQEEVALYVRMLVKRPTTSSEKETYKVPYFVVLSKGNTLILKEKLEAEVTFDPLQKRITPTLSSRLKIPFQKGSHADDYILYVGLQINEGQLDANYTKRKGTPYIKAIKRPLSLNQKASLKAVIP